MLYVVAVFLGSIFDLLHVIQQQVGDTPFSVDESEHRLITYYMISADICFAVSIPTLYAILIIRVHSAFRNSSQRLSRCTLWTLVALALLNGLLMAFMVFVLVQQWIEGEADTSSEFYGVMSIVAALTDNIVNMTLLILFVSKLKRSVRDQGVDRLRETLVSVNGPANVQDVKCSDIESSMSLSQHRFINVMAKFSVLSIFAIICNQIQFIYQTVFAFFLINCSDAYYAFYIMRNWYWLLTVISLGLMVNSNMRLYRMVCGKVHDSVFELHRKHATCVIKKRVVNSLDL